MKSGSSPNAETVSHHFFNPRSKLNKPNAYPALCYRHWRARSALLRWCASQYLHPISSIARVRQMFSLDGNACKLGIQSLWCDSSQAAQECRDSAPAVLGFDKTFLLPSELESWSYPESGGRVMASLQHVAYRPIDGCNFLKYGFRSLHMWERPMAQGTRR